MRRRHNQLAAPEGAEKIHGGLRYWEGAQEIVLRIVLQSPELYAENARVVQNGHHTLSQAKYQHQLRQIRRREARKHASR